MKNTLNVSVLLGCMIFAPGVEGAGPTVPGGFDVDVILSPLPGGFVHQIEAVRVPSYGEGVIYAIAGRGGFKVIRVNDAGGSTLNTIGPFPDGAEIQTIRFDWTGAFQKHLLVSVFHNNGDQPFNYQTDIVKIAPDGTFATMASLGDKYSPMAMHFDISKGAGGFQVGLYLLDADNADGTAMYYIDENFNATLLGPNVLPSGRTGLDPRGIEFAPTDTYGRYLTIADSDYDDGITAVYFMRYDLVFGPLTTPAAIGTRVYGDMAFSSGGALGDLLYVTDSLNKKVLEVSRTGAYKTFATGFNNVQSISIYNGDMYISDADGIYRVRETPPPPPIEIELNGVAVSAGAGADNATGSRMNVGQTATGSMSSGSVILHAGLIPRIKGAVLAPMFGDFSGNRTVDLGDYPEMQSCMGGPNADAGDACALGDSDNDSDVDLKDMAAYINAFGDASR